MSKVKPVYEVGGSVEPGIHVGNIESWEFKEPEREEGKETKKGKVYWLYLRVEGGPSDGARQIDFFHTETKGDFGISRLCGMLEACGAIPKQEIYESEDFKGSKAEQMIEHKSKGRKVGFDVQKDLKTGFMKVTRYMSEKNAQTALSSQQVISKPKMTVQVKEDLWEDV